MIRARPLGLYVHLPWCERKCPYCDFNSHERRDIPEQAYVDALLCDLDYDLASDPAALARREVTSIFIGGGTPSLFSAAAVARLLSGVHDRLRVTDDAEITLEANPGSAETLKFSGFRSAGVKRLSLGIQSFSNTALQRLGRVHDRRQALAAVDAARAAGFENLNLDLMHGLPGQSLAEGLADLEQALALSPCHISWYQLTIEPNTVFYSRPPALPGENLLGDLEDAGAAKLLGSGFERYEVSAWAKDGRECRHNRNYWEFGDYLAIGAGAHGKLTGQDGRITRYDKVRQPEAYLSAAPGAFTASRRTLTTEDVVGEFMLNALRLTGGVPVELFCDATGLPVSEIAGVLAGLRERELIENFTARLCTTPLGLRFLDDVVGEFFTW